MLKREIERHVGRQKRGTELRNAQRNRKRKETKRTKEGRRKEERKYCARNKNTEGIVCFDTLLCVMFYMWLQKKFRNFA